MAERLEEIDIADRVGRDVVGKGEHRRAALLDAARSAFDRLPNRAHKSRPGLRHGLFVSHPYPINADLPAFVEV